MSSWHRRATPTVLQMEAVECGAAALAMVLAHHGYHAPLEQLRHECGVTRDGANATNIMAAAKLHGFTARAFRAEPGDLAELPLPLIAHWNFNHFVVVEAVGAKEVKLNDPAHGPRRVDRETFDSSFTGVVLSIQPGPGFAPSGRPFRVSRAIATRLVGSRSALVFATVAGITLGIPGLIVPSFSRIFVDEILVRGQGGWLRPLLLAMAACALVQASLTYLQRRYLARLETKLALAGASAVIWRLLRLPARFFLHRHAGELATRGEATERVAALLAGRLASTVLALPVIAVYGALMLGYDRALTLLGFTIAGLNVLALRVSTGARLDAHRRLALARGRWFGASTGALQMIETLKATASEDDLFEHWAGRYAKLANATRETQRSELLLGLVPVALQALGAVAILWLGGQLVMDGRLSLGMMIAFQALQAGMLGPVTELVLAGTALQSLDGDLRRVDDVLEQPIDLELAPRTVAGPEGVRLEGRLELCGVDFAYAPLQPPLISGLDLAVTPGSRVAIVGPSGSGKSTVARLIAGLYAPRAGEVRLDGRPRSAWKRATLTSSLAVVDQEILLFEGTVRENICLWDDTVPQERVVRAAKDACLHDDIAARPGGYESRVEEGGRNLSGGQRQRLEIARALVHSPSLLVLDEATSALDPATERALDENLRRRGCTTIIIAHRLSTIRDADEILVMEGGRVVERGTHEELARRADGAYLRLLAAE